MPTPSSPTAPPLIVSVISRYVHMTCPPDESRPAAPGEVSSDLGRLDGVVERSESPQTASDSDAELTTAATESPAGPQTPPPARPGTDGDNIAVQDSVSPSSIAERILGDQKHTTATASPVSAASLPPTLLGAEAAQAKLVPKHTSSFLRNGSKFVGTQQSDRQVYNVQVEIKHVDMGESFICGYLRIEGLTADHPTLTTYFEGEIIGQKYTFQTKHDEWGSNEKVDMQHWNRFQAWRPLARAARKHDFSYKDYAEKENIFMRWKEYFLVPDHRVRTISGASFEGFYYICFNQVHGTVSGIYFHSKSEKFQQLELKHVDDRGCMGAMEFR